MRYSEMTGIEEKALLAKYKITVKKTLYYQKVSDIICFDSIQLLILK